MTFDASRVRDVLVACGEQAWLDGRCATAETLFLEALAYGPPAAPLLCDLGVVYHERGETERARGLFERARALDPAAPEPRQNLAWFAAGGNTFPVRPEVFSHAPTSGLPTR